MAFPFGHSAFGAGVAVTIVRTSKVGVKVGMVGSGVIVGVSTRLDDRVSGAAVKVGASVSDGAKVALGEGENTGAGEAVAARVAVSAGEHPARRRQKRAITIPIDA